METVVSHVVFSRAPLKLDLKENYQFFNFHNEISIFSPRLDWRRTFVSTRVVHLDVEDQVEELLRQLSYAIKNQLVASKAPY